ncbi:MAG: Xaa-Pro peptidase family protein [Proteobacteria bacterium]|nr:Xaa-Pro peptidase family protein [Pseudomonadota bacterium]
MSIQHVRDNRKIDPSQGERRLDGSPDDNNRIEIGPTNLAFDEWAAAGLTPPNLDAMRLYRLNRIIAGLAARDLDAVLLFDPLNIRYASDTTNMQIWNTHNPFRACLVTADGYMVVYDYKNSPFLCDFNPLVREVRSGASMFYFANGDRTGDAARNFVSDLDEIMSKRVGKGRQIAVDKIMVHGYQALVSGGFQVVEGEELMEHTRAIKGPDEILAMRCAMHACEQSVAVMEREAKPGMTEDAIWAHLHAENIKRGGEWIETRLLASGPRTYPWFQECGPRIVQNNEILAFDTDLVGVYGMCSDISRTWFLGDGKPSQEMIDDYRLALDHIEENTALVAPGVHLRDLTFKGHQLPDSYVGGQYSCRFHGVGLCDEWPLVAYPQEYVEGAFDYTLQPGMMLCVEALIGRDGGPFSIKLENQLLVTQDGVENLTSYPWDDRLMGR